jgi:Tol biopolymer transport system component
MPTPIGVAADWLAPLGAQHGFALLDGGVLTLLAPDGRRSALAAGVQTAALAPDGSQIAYTIPGPSGTEVWAVSVELRTRYLVETEPGSVTGLTWSPDEQRLAYEVGTSSGGAIRVRAVNQGSAVTVATGQVSNPGWDADSQHLFVLGLTGSPVRARIYRLPVSGAPQALGGAGMPLTTSRDVGPPIVAPDGHQVAFLSGTELWLMNADGTGAARLSSPSYSCSDPLWTPA